MCNQVNIVDILLTIGTFLASIVSLFIALFSGKIKNKIDKPVLNMFINNPQGKLTKYSDSNEAVRFYHISVINTGNSVAHKAFVTLEKIEEVVNGECKDRWDGVVALNWMGINKEKFCCPNTRDIGATVHICDFISVCKNRLELKLAIFPNNIQHIWDKSTNLIFSVRVISEESYSKLYRINVNWDGDWDIGDKEMGNHLSIDILNDNS